MRRFLPVIAFATALVSALPSAGQAQLCKLRVVSTDGQPVVYAFVTIEGGVGQITDERGEISLGAGKKKTVSATVRRIGYQPWGGKFDLPDTAAVLTVTLSRFAQALNEVRITDSSSNSRIGLKLQGFYDRWMMRQKGTLSATFIGPEEIEFRHPAKITDVLSGLNGVSVGHTNRGDAVLNNYNGQCHPAILVDGMEQCPALGCKCAACSGKITEIDPRRPSQPGSGDPEATLVLIDRILNANDVTAIEVYTRGGNMPVSLQVSDPGCGVVAFWTGSRKP